MASSNSYKGDQFLGEDNYFVWRAKVKGVLRAKGWYKEAIENEKPNDTDQAKLKSWIKANSEALGFMLQTMSNDLAAIYYDAEVAKVLWKELEDHHLLKIVLNKCNFTLS